MTRAYRLLNVFALPGDPFSGNPLAVVEDATGLSPQTCQAIARQFNLSESTFVTAGDGGTDATVRIFTPTIELPFAGHPTLGTAAVVAERAGREQVVLGMPAGPIPVALADGRWTLTANPATVAVADLPGETLAAMLGLEQADLGAASAIEGAAVGAVAAESPAHWVDAGIRQLLVQVRDADAVRRVTPDAPLLRRTAMTPSGEALAYVWAWTGPDTLEARLFFSQDTAVVEDPATGSACANLGSLWAHQGRRDLHVRVSQGQAVARPSLLHITVTAAGLVQVGGLVREIGRGTLDVEG